MKPLQPQRPRRNKLQHARIRSDERKLHALEIFHVKHGSAAAVPPSQLHQSVAAREKQRKLVVERPAVAATSRDPNKQSPRMQKFSEEQLEILDRQVNRHVKEQALAIYKTLVARFYPRKKEKRVLSHDAAAHRVHAAFRYAVSELIDVNAIREKVTLQLESMVSHGGGDHDGFGFLTRLGQKKATKEKEKEKEKDEKPTSLKDKIHAKKEEIHRQKLEADRIANIGKREVRGIKFWQKIVRQKHWKALMPSVQRIKPWEITKNVVFPKHTIDIRGWKEEKGKNRQTIEDARVEWMHEQFQALHEDDHLDIIEEAGSEEEDDDNSEGESSEHHILPTTTTTTTTTHLPLPSPKISTEPSPDVLAFNTKLVQHTFREKMTSPSVQTKQLAYKECKTWEETVTLLQQQGILPCNFHKLWENDRRRWPMRPPRHPSSLESAQSVVKTPSSAAATAATATTTSEETDGDVEEEKQWPNRLGRYLLPNYDLVNPTSTGTLEDYYLSLGKNAPEKSLVGVEVDKEDKVHLVIPPWLRVLAAVSSVIDERSPLRTNCFRWEVPAVPTRPSIHVPRLGGIHSASPAAPLPCSSFAPHAWNHSSSTKDSRMRWKAEHMHQEEHASEQQSKQEERVEESTTKRTMTSHHVERDEKKTMRWTKFLPEGASHTQQTDFDHDLVIRNLICKTTYLSLHSVEHREKTRLLEVRTGGEDETVRSAVISSNPLIFMNRQGRNQDVRNVHDHSSGGGGAGLMSTPTRILPMRIPPFPYRVVHKLLNHLKDYVAMGPEKLKVPFCPLELARVLTAVMRESVKRHKKIKDDSKNSILSKAAGAQILGGLGGNNRKGKGIRGLQARGRRKLTKRRTGMVLLVKEKLPPPQPLDFNVADMFIWSLDMLKYSPKERLQLIVKYTAGEFQKVSSISATFWKQAAVSIDRLEGLAYEISKRAGAEGKVGTVTVFYVTDVKVMARWNVLTLLNEFDMTYNTVSGLLAILFVRYHDVVQWSSECYVDRMMKMRTVMRRELTPNLGGGSF